MTIRIRVRQIGGTYYANVYRYGCDPLGYGVAGTHREAVKRARQAVQATREMRQEAERHRLAHEQLRARHEQHMEQRHYDRDADTLTDIASELRGFATAVRGQ